MCMLTKRTNILFNQKVWKTLTALACQKNLSVAELIRRAVKKTYFSEGEKMAKKRIFNQIISLRKKTKGKINYRQLIENDRRY